MEQPQSSQPLVCPSHATHYVAMVVLGMLIGTAATFMYFKSVPGYQAGFDAAKKLVEQSSIAPMIKTADDIRQLSGSVAGVQGSVMTLHTQSTDPFADPTLADRTVAITSDTKITRIVQKDGKTMQNEMDAFMKATQTGKGTQPTPPTPFTSTPATAADITIGKNVTVVASENIKSAKTFTASEIRIQ